MGKLDGKIALVTGGNSGIGLATAKEFAGEGAYVFITGRRDPELAAAVKEIGSNVTAVRGDVSNLVDLDRLFSQIQREKGRLDVLFANAGVARYAPLGKITEELYDSIFDINVKGLLFTVQKALPLMPDGASIVLNASIVGSKGFSANSVYSATKAAVRSFARTWTTELKDRRIRVNAVSPGATDTPGLNELLASSETGQQRAKMIAATVPLGRFGRPDEIAKAVVFLASDDSSYVTGIELFVDGGVAQVARTGWRTHALSDGTGLRKLDPAVAPVTTGLGVLGMPGFTAYGGLCAIGKPQPGETVVVAAASGPVGSLVGQLAQLAGARAVGIAGGPQKCAFVKDELRFDAAVDHRAADFPARLAAACPHGIDVYFENVGGAIWEAVLPLLNDFARVPVAGLIAQYNGVPPGDGTDRLPATMRQILSKRLTIRGFIYYDFAAEHYADFLREVGAGVAAGRIRYREDIVDGLENAPGAFIGMLEGHNFGKLIVRVAP